MRWKLFAIYILCYQLSWMVSVYVNSLPVSPFAFASWILSFPASIAIISYAFKFRIARPEYWRAFAWLYSTFVVIHAMLVGNALGSWYRWPSSTFDDLVQQSVGNATVLTVLLFKWVAIWRYGRTGAIWADVGGGENWTGKSAQLSASGILSMLRRHRSLQVYVGVCVVLLTILVLQKHVNPDADHRWHNALGPMGYFYTQKAILSVALIAIALTIRSEVSMLWRLEGRTRHNSTIESDKINPPALQPSNMLQPADVTAS
jgi:hypothetical protein